MNIYCLTLLMIVSYGPCSCEIYLNKWAVHLKVGKREADKIAAKYGFINLGKVGTLEDYYLFEHHDVSRRSVEASDRHTKLGSHPEVMWIEQQRVHKRVKRGYKESNNIPTSSASNPLKFNDPLWDKQWYLHGGAAGHFDMNILPAWKKGYSGKGVVVTILDDGIEHNHTDLTQNYDPAASLDINGNDNDPMPRYDSSDTNRHGTRCAGEVAAVANNSACVVGAAFNAKIGGVRMLDGDVSDYVEAQSLSLNPQHVDIYSASWGPDDNGKVVDGPAKLAKEAFIQGVLKGRNGRGSIFVWASGNGGSQSDSCNCDGYTNSIFTISVSSASEKGTKPWYLEECSSTIATTYSSGENYGEKKIITTDLHNKCTDAHTGTSASAPLAAGICALALEANPSLTWRDMQYIMIMTARPEPLVDGEWLVNAVGRKVSHKYGYGIMDASALVDLAERWNTVPAQHICTSDILVIDKMLEGEGIQITMDVDGCRGEKNSLLYLEHVQAKVSLSYSRRGDLKISLISPSGTKSTLLQKRKNDYLEGQFKDWPFMSVHFWGEKPTGTWTLIVENTGSLLNRGKFLKWQLILYGVDKEPVRLKPQKYQDAYFDNRIDIKARYKSTKREIMDYNYGSIPVMQESDDWGAGKKAEENLKEENESWGPKKEWILQQSECDSECKGGCYGKGPEECGACKHAKLPNNGRCVASCPEGSYLNVETGMCMNCEQPCRSCTTSSECTSCSTGLYLHYKSCLHSCPIHYYSDDTFSTCEKCDSTCMTCQDTSTNCVTCKEGLEKIGHSCYAKCAVGQYRTSNKSCGSCIAGCSFCKGPEKADCIHCSENQYHQNGSCVKQCSAGFYLQQLSTGVHVCIKEEI